MRRWISWRKVTFSCFKGWGGDGKLITGYAYLHSPGVSKYYSRLTSFKVFYVAYNDFGIKSVTIACEITREHKLVVVAAVMHVLILMPSQTASQQFVGLKGTRE